MLRAANSSGWVYESTVLLDASPGTMGAMAVGDINNDHYPEIITPSYNDNKVTILTYNPAAPDSPATPSQSHGDREGNPTWLEKLHAWVTSVLG